MKYRARPTVPAEVEGRQFTDEAEAEDLAEWCDGYAYTGTQHGHTSPPWQMHTCLNPEVIDGSKGYVEVGDWIIKHAGVDEVEVLSAEEFTAKYEAAGDA